MATEIQKSEFLTWLSYNSSLSINPKKLYLQRISSENKSTSLIQWTFQNPRKRSLLFSWAQKEYTFPLRKSATADGAAVRWGTAGTNRPNWIAPKSPFPFANAASSITVSINSATKTVNQPRRWLDLMVSSMMSHDEARSNYEYDYTTNYGGHYYQDVHKGFTSQIDKDKPMQYNAAKFQQEIFRRNNILQWPANNADLTVRMTESLIVPPFDPFWGVDKSKVPDHMPWKHMSPVIGLVDRIEYSETFTKLDPGLFNFIYSSTDDAGAGQVAGQKFLALQGGDNFKVNMLLWWYELPTNMSIPQSIDYPAWNVIEYVKDMGTVRAIANNANISVTSPLIQTKSMPSFILIHARRDLDNANYQASSLMSSDGTAGETNETIFNARNSSMPNIMEIVDLDITVGNEPHVINTNIDQRRLWSITKKNSKEIPSFEDWRGYRRGQFDFAAGATVSVDDDSKDNSCHSYVILTAEDLSEELSSGVAYPSSFEVTATMKPHAGYGGKIAYAVGVADDIQYKLYVHLFYSKYFVRLNSDSGGEFQEQLLNFEASRRLTEGASNAVNQISDSMSAMGSLDRLRSLTGTGGSLQNDYRSRV